MLVILMYSIHINPCISEINYHKPYKILVDKASDVVHIVGLEGCHKL